MVSKKIDKNQTELDIRTYDFNIPKPHIFSFCGWFLLKNNYPILGIKENNKKGDRPSYPPCSMLKLLVYVKIDYIESGRVIEEMA